MLTFIAQQLPTITKAKTGTVPAPPYQRPPLSVTAPGSLSAYLDTKVHRGGASPRGLLFAKLEDHILTNAR